MHGRNDYRFYGASPRVRTRPRAGAGRDKNTRLAAPNWPTPCTSSPDCPVPQSPQSHDTIRKMSEVLSREDARSITSGGTILYSSNHERLLTELESSEGQLGAIIRFKSSYN